MDRFLSPVSRLLYNHSVSSFMRDASSCGMEPANAWFSRSGPRTQPTMTSLLFSALSLRRVHSRQGNTRHPRTRELRGHQHARGGERIDFEREAGLCCRSRASSSRLPHLYQQTTHVRFGRFGQKVTRPHLCSQASWKIQPCFASVTG